MYINGGLIDDSDLVTMNMYIENIEPLFWEYRVNVGFYGHTHVFQRQSAVYNKTVVQHSVPVYPAGVENNNNNNNSDRTEDDNSEVIHTYFNPSATVHMVNNLIDFNCNINAIYNYYINYKL